MSQSIPVEICKIAFSAYRGICKATATALAARGVGPVEFFSLDARTLAALTGLKSDFFDDSRRETALDTARKEYDFIRTNNICAAFYTDDDYPLRLQDCEDAPVMLYRIGTDVSGYRHVVSVVGTRHATPYGIGFTDRLIKDLASGLDGELLIVSGLAYGIDVAAHKAALREGVPTGAVMAHGLNTIYPADHRGVAARMIRQGGFLCTEYRVSDRIHKGNFLARNRIVAGLCDVLVVVESDLRGGAMATARIAGEYNREVMAVPGRVGDTYSRGCNNLIATSSAAMIRDASDLVGLLGWETRKPEGVQKELAIELTPQQQSILDFIKSNPDATVNDMCARLGIPYARLSSALFEMEMSDIVMSLPGGKYTPV